MSQNLGTLYQDLFKAYKKAYPMIPLQRAQAETNKIWNDAKKIKDKDEKKKTVENLILNFLSLATKRKASTILHYIPKKVG